MGDFNTRSTLYENLEGKNINKKRTEEFEDFLFSNDLNVKNEYNIKTFENKNGTSVIDLIIGNKKSHLQ